MPREVKVGDTTYRYEVFPLFNTVHANILFRMDRTERLSTSKEWPSTGFFREKRLTPEMYAEAEAWAEEQLDLIARHNKGSISTQ